jgi:hypothetical protein
MYRLEKRQEGGGAAAPPLLAAGGWVNPSGISFDFSYKQATILVAV